MHTNEKIRKLEKPINCGYDIYSGASLPNWTGPVPFIGILTAAVLYAVGSGLIEVLVSPIVEACPFENKDGVMSLLHSFYCWGAVGVILGSTLFFTVFGIANWKILAMIWAPVRPRPLWRNGRLPLPSRRWAFPRPLAIWQAPVCLRYLWEFPESCMEK